jgi:hypothetical protein
MKFESVNSFGGDVTKLPRPDLVAQTPEQDAAVHQQWSSYIRARDAGHLDYVAEARKFDDFYYGDQWEDAVKITLDAQKRPYHTVNLVLSTVNAVVGQYIKSRQDISFSPMGKGAHQDTATSLRFLFKQIALNNDSEQKEKTVFLDGLIQDRGYFYYYLDFSDNVQGEVREEIIDPTDVILDPGAKEYDPDTWSEVFISRWMTPEEIGALYGPEFKDQVDLAAASGTFGHDSLEWEAPNFSGNHYNSEIFFQSTEEDIRRVKRIRVIERQYKKLARTAFFVDNETGDMRRVPEHWKKEKIAEFAVRMELSVMWRPERRIRVTITADKVLLHDDWSIFERISVVPFFPFFRRGRPFGLVRNLISPQEMLNKVTSQELHVVNTTANSGWIFKSGSLVNMDTDDLASQGAKTGIVIEYSGDMPPTKIQPNQVPTGLDQISAKAGTFFREISGVNEAMLGAGRSDSSKALDSRKQGGLAQQEIMFDNLDWTRKLRARLILEIIQTHYTETRLVQIFEKNEDGDEIQTEVALNQPQERIDEETQEAVSEITNDLTLGEYSVVINSVPRRDTYDESLFSQLLEMRNAGVQLPDHVLIEASSLPDRKEVSEIVKSIQGLAAPTEEELQKQAQLEALQMRTLEAEVMEKEAHAQERMALAGKYVADAGAATAKPQLEQMKIGTEARIAIEQLKQDAQQGQMDLMTRIQLMKDKTGSAETIAQISSMTKRTDSALKRQSELEKTVIAQDAKPAAPKPKAKT